MTILNIGVGVEKQRVELLEGPDIVDVFHFDNLVRAAELAAEGEPIGFVCREPEDPEGGPYGLGGNMEAFLEYIGQWKRRNFMDNPPVALPTKKSFLKVLDVERMTANGRQQAALLELFAGIYDQATVHLVVPVKEEYAGPGNPLPLAIKTEDGYTHALMASGRIGHLQTLIQLYEGITRGDIFMATSANRRHEPTLTSAAAVAETFNGLPLVLADKDRYSGRSHPLINCNELPERVSVAEPRGPMPPAMQVLLGEFFPECEVLVASGIF